MDRSYEKKKLLIILRYLITTTGETFEIEAKTKASRYYFLIFLISLSSLGSSFAAIQAISQV